MSKLCRKCRVVKPANEFHKHKETLDRLTSWCIACVKQSSRDSYLRNRNAVIKSSGERHKQNPEQGRAATAKWRAANPEQCRAKERAWRVANPEKIKARDDKRNAHTKLLREEAHQYKWESETKICRACKLEKDKSEFHPDNSRHSSGDCLRSRCKKCNVIDVIRNRKTRLAQLIART